MMLTQTTRDYSEKRDFMRMRVNSEITLYTGSKKIVGICKDLSGTGMLISVEEPLAIGAELTTALPSQNANFPPFETVARVLRVEQGDDGVYYIGLEIVEVKR